MQIKQDIYKYIHSVDSSINKGLVRIGDNGIVGTLTWKSAGHINRKKREKMVCTERSHQCKDVSPTPHPNQPSPSDQRSLHACTYMWLRKGRHIVHYSALCCFDLHTTFITLIQIQKLDITKCLGVILNEKQYCDSHENSLELGKYYQDANNGILSFKNIFWFSRNCLWLSCYLALQMLMYYFI